MRCPVNACQADLHVFASFKSSVLKSVYYAQQYFSRPKWLNGQKKRPSDAAKVN
jgi:hypothetical protein